MALTLHLPLTAPGGAGPTPGQWTATAEPVPPRGPDRHAAFSAAGTFCAVPSEQLPPASRCVCYPCPPAAAPRLHQHGPCYPGKSPRDLLCHEDLNPRCTFHFRLLTLGFSEPVSERCSQLLFVLCRPMSKLESQQPRPLTLGLPTRPR